jgi:predicted ATPase
MMVDRVDVTESMEGIQHFCPSSSQVQDKFEQIKTKIHAAISKNPARRTTLLEQLNQLETFMKVFNSTQNCCDKYDAWLVELERLEQLKKQRLKAALRGIPSVHHDRVTAQLDEADQEVSA